MVWVAGYFPNRPRLHRTRREIMSAESTHPLATKRLVIGHLTICQGCCCGNTENGRPPVPVDWLKKEWRARGLLERLHNSSNTVISSTGRLGPGTRENCCPFQRSFTGTPCIPFVRSIQAVGVEFSHFKYRFTRSMSSSVASACSVVGLRLGSTT